MSTPVSWYTLSNEAEVFSPTLLVYPDRVDQNIRRTVEIAGDAKRLWPHVKTHKMAAVLAMQIAAGIDKFKCATIAEAEMTAAGGAAEVLLAYAPVGPNVVRWRRLMQAYPQVRFGALFDDTVALQSCGAELHAHGLTCAAMIDIDCGMGRTGIAPDEHAASLYAQLARTPGITPAGLHVYDGHIVDPNLGTRRTQSEAAMVGVFSLRDRLLHDGLPVPRVICGGTPTFAMHAEHADRDCSPGTTVFWDAGYGGKYPELPFEPAALLLTRVISKPRPGRLCVDLGYKAVSADQPHPRVQFLNLPDAKAVVHSEEHLAIETSAADRFQVGDALYGVPQHVCPTVALHREAIVVREGVACDRWPVTARDRVITI
ncbi:MAG: D-TA family PLP-dependent enzyme [Planctomycetia bacterium]|nr:D-TA family PLP-dependent enzyme [Planctomycetia bacterium]